MGLWWWRPNRVTARGCGGRVSLGHVTKLSAMHAEAVAEMSRQSLEVVDVESLRPHYARTLAWWAERLVAKREQAVAHAGEKRYRIWQIYLAGCSHAFDRGWMSIHQILAVRKRKSGPCDLPWTRAYMYPSS